MVMVWLVNPSTDAVVYGYASRGHWYWHNGYGTRMISILVWKDYNCVSSRLLTYNNASTQSSTLRAAINNAYNADNSLAAGNSQSLAIGGRGDTVNHAVGQQP